MVSSSLCTSSHTMPLISFWPAAEELSSLFEKKNFRVKSPCSGKQSILSVRLEQCPLQLNNPFNEYSKFDGKVSDQGALRHCSWPLTCASCSQTSQWPAGIGSGYLETSNMVLPGSGEPFLLFSLQNCGLTIRLLHLAIPFSSRLVRCTFIVKESWDVSLELMMTPFV